MGNEHKLNAEISRDKMLLNLINTIDTLHQRIMKLEKDYATRMALAESHIMGLEGGLTSVKETIKALEVADQPTLDDLKEYDRMMQEKEKEES